MQINFTVHSVVPSTETVEVDVAGSLVPATISATEVTLVSDHYGSLVLKFVGAEATEAKEAFIVDDTKTWTV